MDAKKGKSWNGLAIALVLTIVLPVLYTASVGPMAWLVANDNLSPYVLEVYMPLGVLCSFSDPGTDMFNAYVDWWTG